MIEPEIIVKRDYKGLRADDCGDAKNLNGYCGIGGTGVACPIGLTVENILGRGDHDIWSVNVDARYHEQNEYHEQTGFGHRARRPNPARRATPASRDQPPRTGRRCSTAG